MKKLIASAATLALSLGVAAPALAASGSTIQFPWLDSPIVKVDLCTHTVKDNKTGRTQGFTKKSIFCNEKGETFTGLIATTLLCEGRYTVKQGNKDVTKKLQKANCNPEYYSD